MDNTQTPSRQSSARRTRTSLGFGAKALIVASSMAATLVGWTYFASQTQTSSVQAITNAGKPAVSAQDLALKPLPTLAPLATVNAPDAPQAQSAAPSGSSSAQADSAPSGSAQLDLLPLPQPSRRRFGAITRSSR